MDLQSDNNVTTLLTKVQNTGQSEKLGAGLHKTGSRHHNDQHCLKM